MKGKNLILIGLIGLLVGLALVLFRHPLASGGVVTVAGILFVGAGVLNMTVFLGSRDKKGKSRMGVMGTTFGWIASAAAVVLGLAMLFFNHVFTALVGFMFAVLLLFAAVFQIFLLIFGTRPVRISNWFFLVPLAIIGAAIYIFLRKPTVPGETTDVLVTGIAFMVFGLFTVIEGSAIGQANRMLRKQSVAVGSEAPKPAIGAKEETTEAKEAEKPEEKA